MSNYNIAFFFKASESLVVPCIVLDIWYGSKLGYVAEL